MAGDTLSNELGLGPTVIEDLVVEGNRAERSEQDLCKAFEPTLKQCRP